MCSQDRETKGSHLTHDVRGEMDDYKKAVASEAMSGRLEK